METSPKVNNALTDVDIDPDARIEKLMDQSLFGMMFVVVLTLLILLLRVYQYGLETVVVVPFVACTGLLVALVFRHKIPAHKLHLGIIAVVICVTASAMTRFGMLTPAVLAMAVLPVVVGSARGTKPAIAVAILMIITIIVIALLYVFGILYPVVPQQDYMQQPLNWLVFALVYAAIAWWGAVVTGMQTDGWKKSISALTVSQEETLREKESVAKLQRKESISQLSGGVAHDFNNVLAAIMSNIEVARELSSRNESPEIIDESLNAALETAERGSELTRSLLSFANVAVLEPKQLNVNEVVEQSIRWISRTVPENIEIKTSLTENIRLVKVDETSLSSALLNLIINARDAMPDGGCISIATRNVVISGDEDQPLLNNIGAGDYVELVVEDSGVGIDPSEREKIFEPFYSTKEPGQGSGLGLAMVQGFMKQSGGAVTVTPNTDAGVMFQLLFQVCGDEPVEKAVSPVSIIQRESGFNNASLLIVEDEPGIASSLQTMLEYSGYKVRTAVNGDVAWQALCDDPDVDLVLSDIVMSGKLQGTDLAKRILQTMDELPVILMSGYAFSLKEELHQHAVSQYLEKPIRKAVLINAIETALEKRSAHSSATTA